MGISSKDPNFVGAAQNCKFCKDYCEQENIYNRDGNVHSRQALVYLECIENSAIAKDAKKVCSNCDYRSAGVYERSAGIMKILEHHFGIRV